MSSLWHKTAALGLGTTIAGTIVILAAISAGLQPTALIQRIELEAARLRSVWPRNLILSDLSDNPPGEWAGTYEWSNRYEHRVVNLGPRGFFYEYRHCTGTGELAYGDVTSVDGLRVHLKSRFRICLEEPRERESTRRSDFGWEDELYSIPWGDERFLVPASLMHEFCSMATATGFNSMKYADYPRKLRAEKASPWDRPELVGLPGVPPEFRHLLPE